MPIPCRSGSPPAPRGSARRQTAAISGARRRAGTAANTVATFGSTAGTTQVTIDSPASAAAILLTSSAAAPFNFSINGGGSLTLTTLGVVNNSAYAPVFNVGNATTTGSLIFANAATAGNATIINTNGTTTFG